MTHDHKVQRVLTASTVVLAFVAFGLFETLRSREMSWDGLYATRGAILGAVLLFANLMVLWWYARRTSDMASATKEMAQQTAAAAAAAEASATSTRESAEAAKAQAEFLRIQHLQANKPIVFTERIVDTADRRAFHYYARNVGGGIAVNVWYVGHDLAGRRIALSLGALGPGEKRLLPDTIEPLLCDRPGDFRHAVFAEGIVSRTSRWSVTLNVRGHDPGTEMTSGLAESLDTREPETFREYLNVRWPAIDAQLQRLQQAGVRVEG